MFQHSESSGLQWKGADVANSLALGDGRILWVFGDTLYAEPGSNRCNRFKGFNISVHNSMSVQYGSDPTTAEIKHFWGWRDGRPSSFFEPTKSDGSWFWMGSTALVEGHVLVFLMQARALEYSSTAGDTCAGLNFEIIGWQARMAKLNEQEPADWNWREMQLPVDNNWHNILAGSSSILVRDGHLYAYAGGPGELIGNRVYLARWPLAKVLQYDLSEPQWHTDRSWQYQDALAAKYPSPIVIDGNNEVDISPIPWSGSGHTWLFLQSAYGYQSPLCYRTGKSLTQFGPCQIFYSPPELERYPSSPLLVYALKLHPELSGQEGDSLIGTYMVNSCRLEDIQEKCDLYYPQFLQLKLAQ
ncbi:hypothetical protein EYC98_20795 [Halieaceae bacterium IMCC14734]|uniref:DUF4185 domain-containing protein n=1 Tax=Candidatus Litorirhabdus singularis TaxID=2518993 RepID=A0ABT3TLU1_9GAMM|nr:hypothetical protein [Candidatus Litorirhabdus singularis]MCX2983307.1 hypothetical protein [Candidatus Litorirhabdus singularis]